MDYEKTATEYGEELSFSKAEDFLECLSPRHPIWSDDPMYYRPVPDNPETWIYRGHADATWELKAMAVREPRQFQKYSIDYDLLCRHPCASMRERRKAALTEALERFERGLDRAGIVIPTQSPAVNPPGSDSFGDGDKDFVPRDVLPLMALAQHHGLPTVLLDWTRKAWIAAYFASVEAAKELEENRPQQNDTPLTKTTHLAVWALNRKKLEDAALGSKAPFFYNAPGGTNPNLNAQSGLFTITPFAADDKSLETYIATLSTSGGSLLLRKFLLPFSESRKLLRLLAWEGITGASMFPGADGVVKAMQETLFWDERPIHPIKNYSL
jgi:hypothetical protein